MAITRSIQDSDADDDDDIQDDIYQEFAVDEEDLPDADSEDDGLIEQISEESSAPVSDDSIHAFSGHTGSVFCVACSTTDSTLVATGGGDDKAYIWRIGDGESHRVLLGHTDSVNAISFSSNGQLLASGGLDGIVNIWEVSTGTLRHRLDGPAEGIEWVKWHQRGDVVLAGSGDFSAWMWNAANGNFLRLFTGHRGSVTCGDFTPNGKTICTGSDDHSLRIWNPRNNDVLVVNGHPYHTDALTCLALNGDSTLALTGSTDCNACLVNIQNGRVVGTLSGHSKSVECVGFSPSLPLAATGGMDGKLIIWDLQTLTPRCTCEHEDGVVRLIWSSRELIYTGSVDNKVRIWDGRSGRCEFTFQGHKNSILDIAITCDGRHILSGSDDNSARVFEAM